MIRMPTNRLIHEQSPYLLQHAHNPVDWFPWCDEAFAKAGREHKPVLLSIGYSTCHWCHVMAHESFEREDIAALLNAHFVPVKVDREERPDIDHIYMNAVTAMTGQGGWPLTVFLTPERKPFFGGTYFPPVAKWGAVGFKDLLSSVHQAWQANAAQIAQSSQELTEALRQSRYAAADQAPQAIPKDNGLFEAAFRQMASQFDPTYGGFGTAPKFPMGHSLSFLLLHAHRRKEPKALAMVEATLKAMGAGGIYDHLGGGFHRYATDGKWQVPHFEKMLYDQALLAFAYARGFQSTGNALYERIVRETLDYVLRDLTSPAGGFYCAQDADSEGREGAFYVWTDREIQAVLDPKLLAVFAKYYPFAASGNVAHDPQGEFTGQNILFQAQDIAPQDWDMVRAAQKKLFARRKERIHPHLDDKVLTDWNGLMIAALAFCGSALNEPRYLEAAAGAADFILANLKEDGRLLHRWRDGQAAIAGLLDDYAFFLLGLLELYEATASQRYLTQARALAERMGTLFADPGQGGFYMTPADSLDLIVRPQDIYDGALPSGNSVAALVLIKLSYLCQEEQYKTQAEGLFNHFLAAVRQAPQAYSFFLSAFDFYLHPAVEVWVEWRALGHAPGPPTQETIASLRKVVYKHYVPTLVLRHTIGAGPSWVMHVCRQAVCLPPTSDLNQLDQMLIQSES